MNENGGGWRPYRTQYGDIVECTKSLWLVVEDRARQMIGTVPIVAYGREMRETEYGSQTRWLPLVCHEWTLCDAESVPGALGIVVGRGGEPPSEATLRSLIVEDENEKA